MRGDEDCSTKRMVELQLFKLRAASQDLSKAVDRREVVESKSEGRDQPPESEWATTVCVPIW